MAEIVLRVRLIGGDHADVTDGEPDTGETQEIIDRAIAVAS